MYNLIITATEGAWEEVAHVLSLSRFLEYTDDGLKEKFAALTEEAIRTLSTVPTLFAYEIDVHGSARVGWIKKIQKRGSQIRITPEMDQQIPAIPSERLKELSWDLEIGSYEQSRTHWAIKKADLLSVLSEHGLLAASTDRTVSTTRSVDAPYRSKSKSDPVPEASTNAGAKPKVFLVHGHDHNVKNDVARFLEQIGLEVVILHERPNLGRTLISKFKEESTEVVYAVVLITPDDVGKAAGAAKLAPRARQNVVFELGFFLGRLGSERVCALLSGDVEKPSDFDAVVYVTYAANSDWRRQIARELMAIGIPFDHAKLL